jgi:pullulanase
VNFAAILVGDVNGSWQAPADAATLDEAFFSESALASGAPLYLWGLRDSDGDGLTDTQEAALGTNPNLADSDSDGVDDALDAYPLDASRSAQASAPERIMAAAPLAGTSACGSNGPCESSQSSSEGLSSSTGAQERDVDPSTLIDLSSIAQPILLRGDMNDWGTDQAFTQTGEGEYQVLVTLKPGSYAFKVATADWMALDLGAASLEARSVEVGQPTVLVLNSTEVLEVSVEATAAFVFTLVQTPAAAVHLVLSEEIVH